jgi:chromate reductase, NAD(P)H dehydrogenase (quinone)
MKVLAISGSLRSASVNSALLRVTARLAAGAMDVRVYAGIRALPLFDPDLEAELPSAVIDLREAVAAADALIFASPEYAHGVTGVIKNVLDWLVSFAPFAFKPVAIFSASPRSRYADPALRETLQTMSAAIVDEACFASQLVGAKLSESDMFHAPHISAGIKAALAALNDFRIGVPPSNASFPLLWGKPAATPFNRLGDP